MSPMVATEPVLTMASIDATEGHDIYIVDTPGGLLTAGMDNAIILALERELAEIMEMMSLSTYREYITYGKY